MIDEAVILAAGKGTRMKSDVQKVLLPVDGRPMIYHVLDTSRALGVRVPVVVIGHQGEKVEEATKDYGGMTPLFVSQDNAAGGTGQAVRLALPFLAGEWVAVLYGDMPFARAESLKQLADKVEKQEAVMGLLTTKIEPNSHYGRIVRDTDGKVQKIVEWKNATGEERAITEGNTGLYVFYTPWLVATITKLLPNPLTGEEYLTDFVELAVETKQRVIADLTTDPREGKGFNTQDELASANLIEND